MYTGDDEVNATSSTKDKTEKVAVFKSFVTKKLLFNYSLQ